MATKKISVNPEFFKLNGSKTLKKKSRRDKKTIRDLAKRENKELKMKLIDKIKEHKKKKIEEEKKKLNEHTTQFDNDFDNSLSYLQGLSTKHKSKKDKRRERKLARKMERMKLRQQNQQQYQYQQHQSLQQQHQSLQHQPFQQHQPLQQPSSIRIHTEQSPIIPNIHDGQHIDNMLKQPMIQLGNMPVNNMNTPQSPAPSARILNQSELNNITYDNNESMSNMQQCKPDPPYGILKHGRKPLFSVYNKTLRKPNISHPKPNIIIENGPNQNIHTDAFFQRQQNLEKLKQSVSGLTQIPNPLNVSGSSIMPNRSKTLKKMKQLKTTTKRYIHLGKKDGRVGVLIKNQKTRKKILKDTNTLKKRPLSKIKNYLRKHNLIKIGSIAPEHIIRSIYENSYLAGDIYNKNVDTLLHNYLDE